MNLNKLRTGLGRLQGKAELTQALMPQFTITSSDVEKQVQPTTPVELKSKEAACQWEDVVVDQAI